MLGQQTAQSGGSIVWSDADGYEFIFNKNVHKDTMPLGLYLLLICFMRLANDEEFQSDLLSWAKEHQH